jgi:hypothetical protein
VEDPINMLFISASLGLGFELLCSFVELFFIFSKSMMILHSQGCYK